MSRPAVVAGSFYPGVPQQIQRQLDALWPDPAPPAAPYLAAMVPHAGYIYSGKTAAQVYARLVPAATYVLLGPNHTGLGAAVAVASDQSWETPGGEIPVDQDFQRLLLELCPEAKQDDRAHRREHALEVQLPFLQRLGGDFTIVPVTLGTWRWPVLQSLGQAVAAVVRRRTSRTVILASSDMNHFENLDFTRQVDRLALNKITALDPAGLIEEVTREGISMCGVAPAAAMLAAALDLGARSAEVVSYTTSAEVSGDEERVVGYAGVLVR
jgi:MEMO1 family protein